MTNLPFALQYRLCFALLLLTLGVQPLCGQQLVPRTLTYCNLTLELTPNTQQRLEAMVQGLQAGPYFFHQMVQRARVYMPFIEEAFAEVGVPADLRFLAIQESALRPDAVSTSQAVGFWQFKQPTAEEMGLYMDERVDERRHIFRASLAAARYLAKLNADFDNWAYAVIAYYEGPTGAVAHTNPMYYSQRRMRLDEDTHLYLLKAIAHKLAYEAALAEPGQPEQYLLPHSTVGEMQPEALAAEHGLSLEEWRAHNPWFLAGRRLPQVERPFTYYVPVTPDQYPGHQPDPTLAAQAQLAITDVAPSPLMAPSPSDLAELSPSLLPAEDASPPTPAVLTSHSHTTMPRAADPRHLASSSYAIFPIRADLDYDQAYALAEGPRSLVNLSLRHDIPLSRLMAWNGFEPGEKSQAGELLYLVKPRKAQYHVVLPGESLADVAQLHRTKVKRIQRKNRMDRDEQTIYIGQKLYLRRKKPKGEKMIVLVAHWEPGQAEGQPLEQAATQAPVAQPVPTSVADIAAESLPPAQITPTPKATPTVNKPSQPEESLLDDPRIWITHVVETGETLWKISQRYDTKVAIIKRSNGMADDAIHPGQELQILVRTSVLERLAATRD